MSYDYYYFAISKHIDTVNPGIGFFGQARSPFLLLSGSLYIYKKVLATFFKFSINPQI